MSAYRKPSKQQRSAILALFNWRDSFPPIEVNDAGIVRWKDESALTGYRHRLGFQGNPRHDLAWFRKKWRQLQDEGMAQEHLGDFRQSGRPWIHREYLPDAVRPLADSAIARELVGIEGGRFYVSPEKVTGHVLSFADTAEGLKHGDFNAVGGYDRRTGAQVFQLHNKLAPEELATVMGVVSRIYRGEHVYEANNLSGGAYGLAARRVGVKGLRGVKTTTLNRPLYEKEANRMLRLGELGVKDFRVLEECAIVCYDDKGKVQAPSGYHDDAWFSMIGVAYHISRSGGDDAPRAAVAGRLESADL